MAKRKQKTKANTNTIWWLIFIVYIGLMLWLLLWRRQTWIPGLSYRQMLQENINLKPFYTIDNYLNVIFHYPQSYYFRHCIINLFGNILLFIPAGWLLPQLFQCMRKFLLFFLTCAIFLFFIEFLQLFALLGSFDIDDIILNIFGMMIGYTLFACMFKE